MACPRGLAVCAPAPEREASRAELRGESGYRDGWMTARGDVLPPPALSCPCGGALRVLATRRSQSGHWDDVEGACPACGAYVTVYGGKFGQVLACAREAARARGGTFPAGPLVESAEPVPDSVVGSGQRVVEGATRTWSDGQLRVRARGYLWSDTAYHFASHGYELDATLTFPGGEELDLVPGPRWRGAPGRVEAMRAAVEAAIAELLPR